MGIVFIDEIDKSANVRVVADSGGMYRAEGCNVNLLPHGLKVALVSTKHACKKLTIFCYCLWMLFRCAKPIRILISRITRGRLSHKGRLTA